MNKQKWTKRIDVAISEDGSDWLPVSRITPGSPSISRRLGRFYVHLCFYGEHVGMGMTEMMMVLSQVVPVRVSPPHFAGHMPDWLFNYPGQVEMTYEVVGFSEHFRALNQGERIPEYKVAMHQENGYVVWFEFQEV